MTRLVFLILLMTSHAASAAISVNTAMVPRTTGHVADFTDVTTASFTPPAGALLLVMVSLDSGTSDLAAAVSDSQGLTWTKIAEADPGTGTVQRGHSSAWYAQTITSTSMTVSVQRATVTSTNGQISFKIYVVTGHDPIQPIGASNFGGTATQNFTASAYTSTVNNSRAFGLMTDYLVVGTPSSTDTADVAVYPGLISVSSIYKAADTPSENTAVTLNFDSGAASPETTWVGFEVRPAPTGTCSSPTGVTGQLNWISASGKVKYCDGVGWVDTTNSPGASCAGTTRGTISYTSGALSYCNNSDIWSQMKGANVGSCSGTTAGTYNYTSNYYRFCDGSNWYKMSSSKIKFEQVKLNDENLNNNAVSSGAFSGAVTSGNAMVCAVIYNSGAASVSSVSDTAGNTYTKAVGPITGAGTLANWRQEIWYVGNMTGGAGVNVTATMSATFASYKRIICHEYSGVARTSPIDQTVQTAGNSANAVSGSMTTTSDNQMIFAVGTFGGVGGTNDAGFAQRALILGTTTEDTPATTAGNYTASFSNSSQRWLTSAITLKPL